MSLLGIFSILTTGIGAIKEASTPSISVENWANKELYHKDMMSGMSQKELMKNVENGKYKLTQTYPEPHRDPKTGKIIIENSELYYKDVREYGAVQAQTWVKQGKYNLTPEELEKERERIRKKSSIESDEERKKRLEDQARKKAELQQRKKVEQDLAEARQLMADDCRKILAGGNYINVDFFLRHRSGISNEPYGYNIARITAQKDDEKYSVGFEVISLANLSEYDGNALLKLLATIMANVDLRDLDNRNSLIKQVLMSEEIVLLNNDNFSIKNDILCLSCSVNNLSVELQFYASQTRLQQVQLNFDSMEGHEFEFFCASLLRKNGYEQINVTRGSGDQGIDIICYRDGIKYGIQCKCYSADIGNKAVQEVFAGKAFYECHIGIVLTNQYFTKSAIELAKKNGIILWDRKKLMELIEKAGIGY